MTATAPKTPGFNCRLTIEFKTDRNGRLYAQKISSRNPRWVRCNLADAQSWVAQGLADEVERG